MKRHFDRPKLLGSVGAKPKFLGYGIPYQTQLTWVWCPCETHDVPDPRRWGLVAVPDPST